MGFFRALSLAFRQASDPALRRVFWRAAGGALVVLIGLWALCWWGLAWLGGSLADWLAAQDPGGWWIDPITWLVGAGGLAAVLIASFFLFPAVMVGALSLLLEQAAEAVERRHYPDLRPARPQPVLEALWLAVSFGLLTLFLNLLALPLYLLLLFVPPLNVFVFYGLNGYLLGREYFELVAARRLDASATKRLRRRHRGRVFAAGTVIAFLLTLPLINLAMPIVATAFMLHLFEDLRRKAEGAPNAPARPPGRGASGR
ncbi:MAG: EI24 domain-containing protein [Kiloniellales bacterium]